MERIRRVCPGDEERLAYVQTESWKAAFREIVPAEILAKCTELEPARAMYRHLLNERFAMATFWSWTAKRTASHGGARRGTKTWPAARS